MGQSNNSHQQSSQSNNGLQQQQPIQQQAQNSQNAQLSQIISQYGKQQIIIVSQAGNTTGANPSVSQGVVNPTNIQGLGQVQPNSGGNGALSLSGLSAQQLTQILQAYGVIGGQGNIQSNNQITNQTSAHNRGEKSSQSNQPGQSGFAGQPTSPNNTNIIVVQASPGGGQLGMPQGSHVIQQPPIQIPVTSQIPPQGQSSLGQSLQQQIQQLQSQNSIMQQQIIANAAIHGGNQHSARNQIINSPLNQYISENDMLLQNLTHQLHQHQKQQIQQQQINNLQRQINQMRAGPQHNSQGEPDIAAVRTHSSKPIDNSRGQRNSMPVHLDGQIPSEDRLIDHFDNIQSSHGHAMDDQHRKNKPVYDSNNFRNIKHTQGSSDQQYRNKSQVIQKQNTGKKGSKVKTPANQDHQLNHEQTGKKTQDSTIYYTSAKKSKDISQPIKHDLEQQQNKQKAKSAQKTFSSTYKRSDMHQGSSLQQQSTNQRLLYQSATQRQKGQYDHQNSNNFNTQQQINSPAQTRGNSQQINMAGAKNDATDKKMKSKKKKNSKLIGDNALVGINSTEDSNFQQPRQSGHNPISSDKKHLSSNRVTTAQQNLTSERITIVDQPSNQSPLKKNRNQIESINNKIQTLQLPPQVPQPQQLTAKEKKKLKLEKEREREQELFEKNFKASDLYICKMGLNIQKTFISRPNAIVVYHQDRMIQLDTTLPVTAVQPSNVPKSVVPPAINPVKPMLITPDMLDDFYNHSQISYFSNLGRALEVQEEPKFIFQKDQETVNLKDHSIQERKIKEVLDEQLKLKFDSQKVESLAKNPIIFPAYNIKETTIFFNSRFESGNLREVEKLNEFEYNCFVNFDYNSSNHSQWFFFSVRNIGKGRQYKFNIMNLQKDESCYQIGMKPFVYSIKKNKEAGTNLWKRGCENVCYYKNKLRTKARECCPDYEFDEENIPCYEYEDQASQMVTLNTLSFCHEFEMENDITYFAYFQPYTLTDLEDYLFLINKKFETEHLQNIYKCEKLCNTVGNNPCYVLTITDNVQDDDIQIENFKEADNDGALSTKDGKVDQLYLGVGNGLNSSRAQETNKASSRVNKAKDKQNLTENNDEDNADNSILSGLQIIARDKKDSDPNSTSKPTVFLSARVHPGESNASFMIQGAIDFLLQKNNKEAKLLRETFIFKIIPMLNPDGVVNGHYRTNFVGADLNRRWPNPSKLLHPTIYYAKKLLKMCHQDNQVLLFCDFHGHTRKRNVFMYGCVSPQTEVNQHKNNNLIRIVPYLLDQKNKNFSFADCKFGNEKEKDSTGRMVMFKEFGILNSYTIESTFYSHYHPRMGQRKKVNVEDELQIKVEELVEIGNDFCETLTAIINSKILKRKFIVDTTTPMGIPQPGQGGNPLTGFLMNQEKEKNAALLHQNNSATYNQQNNVQSVIKSFINGPQQMTPYQFLGNQALNQMQQAQAQTQNKKVKCLFDSTQYDDHAKKSERVQILSDKKAKDAQDDANLPQIQRKFKLMQQQIKSNQQSQQNSTQNNPDLNAKDQKISMIDKKQNMTQQIKPQPNPQGQSFQTEQPNQQYNTFKKQMFPVEVGPKKQKAKSSYYVIQDIDLKNKTDELNSIDPIHQSNRLLQKSNENQEDIYQSLRDLNENNQRKSKPYLKSADVSKMLGDQSNRSNSLAMQQQNDAIISSSQTIQDFHKVDKINEQDTYEESQNRKQYSPHMIEEDQDLLMGPTQMNIIDDYINKQTQSGNYDINMDTFEPQQVQEKPIVFNMPQPEAQQSRNPEQSMKQDPILVRKSRTPAHGPRDKTRTSQQIISSQQDKIDSQIDMLNQYQYDNLQKNQCSEFSQYVTNQMNENKSEKNLNVLKQNISYQAPIEINQNAIMIQQNHRIALQNQNRRSDQGSIPVMREQKSKSSLSMMHTTQNQSNQMIKTPMKKLSENQVTTYASSKTQKVKQNLYKHGLLNSAPIRHIHVNPRNSMGDSVEIQSQPQQKVQNFCLPGPSSQSQQEQSQGNMKSIQKQKNMLDYQQRMLAQRKQQAEMQAQQISNNIMNARQSYQTSNIENSSTITIAAQNFKIKYGGNSQVLNSEQSVKPYSRGIEKSRPQTLYVNQPTPYSANSVLPNINQENPGGSRIVQVVEHQRPGSQSIKKEGLGQASYPHRNIVVPQAPTAPGQTMTQRLVNLSEQRIISHDNNSMGAATGSQDPNSLNDKRISQNNNQ